MARRLREFPRGRQRRLTSWELGPGDATQMSISATGPVIMGQFITATQDGLTIIRIRGAASFFLASGSVAGSGFAGAFGIGMTTVTALATGVTAVPTPITEQAWDGWLFWMPIFCHTLTATLADGVNAAASVMNFEVDTKAMRKLTIEDAIYASYEAEVETGVASLRGQFDSRSLVKLP